LPIEIQSFSKLREENYLYVDNTVDIHRIVTGGNIYFLSPKSTTAGITKDTSTAR
jgi:hypothetical protein